MSQFLYIFFQEKYENAKIYSEFLETRFGEIGTCLTLKSSKRREKVNGEIYLTVLMILIIPVCISILSSYFNIYSRYFSNIGRRIQMCSQKLISPLIFFSLF